MSNTVLEDKSDTVLLILGAHTALQLYFLNSVDDVHQVGSWNHAPYILDRMSYDQGFLDQLLHL